MIDESLDNSRTMNADDVNKSMKLEREGEKMVSETVRREKKENEKWLEDERGAGEKGFKNEIKKENIHGGFMYICNAFQKE